MGKRSMHMRSEARKAGQDREGGQRLVRNRCLRRDEAKMFRIQETTTRSGTSATHSYWPEDTVI